jgi:competence protein ComEA
LLLITLVAVAAVAILSSLNSVRPYRTANSVLVSTAPTSSAVIAAQLYVHVVGEVEHPGIYCLDSGSRMYDAIFAAGGFSNAADPASVNLARQITDGEQILISAIGAAVPVGGASTSSLISLNRASQSEFESLPRVGPALAGRLIDWRQTNGGFKSKQDLLKVDGIGPKLFTSIESLVTL